MLAILKARGLPVIWVGHEAAIVQGLCFLQNLQVNLGRRGWQEGSEEAATIKQLYLLLPIENGKIIYG